MTFFNTIILLGSIQGGISFFLLWKADKNKVSNRLLAILILLISMACFNIFLLEQDLKIESVLGRFLLIILPLTVIMPLGPLVYYYVRSITQKPFEFQQKDLTHFLPVILDMIPYLLYLVSYLLVFADFLSDQNLISVNNFAEGYDKYVDIPRWVSISVYLWFTIRLIRRNEDGHNVKWSRQLTIVFLGFQIIWLIFLVLYLYPETTDWLLSTLGWYPLYIPLTMMVYWFGIKGFLINANLRNNQGKPVIMKTDELDNNIQVLNQAMEEAKLYLNSELSLNDVVSHTNLPQKTISMVLNQHLGKSFNEYVNGYRVAAVKLKIDENQNQNMTLTGIAYVCGFNSQATFQRAFKAITNQTPGQYAKSVKKLAS